MSKFYFHFDNFLHHICLYEREDYCKLLPTIKIKRRDSKRLELICKTWRKESSENNCEYEVIIKHTGKEIKIIKLNSFHSECCKYSKYMTTTNNNKDTLNHERMLFLKSLNSTISTTTALCKGYVYSCNDDTTLSTARTTVAISALDADSTSYSNDDNTSPVTQTTLAINALDADSTTTNLHCNNDITSPATQTTLAINALDADSTTTNLHCNNDITFPATQTTVAIVDANTLKRSCVDLVDELWTLELDEGDKKKCAYSILQATKSICGLDALQYGIMSMLNDFPISSNEFSLLKQRYREEPKLFPHPFSTSLKKTPVVDRKEREREQALFIQLQELTRQDELYDEVYYHDK